MQRLRPWRSPHLASRSGLENFNSHENVKELDLLEVSRDECDKNTGMETYVLCTYQPEDSSRH